MCCEEEKLTGATRGKQDGEGEKGMAMSRMQKGLQNVWKGLGNVRIIQTLMQQTFSGMQIALERLCDLEGYGLLTLTPAVLFGSVQRPCEPISKLSHNLRLVETDPISPCA